MSTPEALIAAIRDRIAAGHDTKTIKEETLAAGHSEAVFEVAYAAAKSTPESELPSVLSIWKAGYQYMRQEWKFTLLLALPLLIVGIADLVAEEPATKPLYVMIAGIISLLGSLLYAYLMVILLGKITGESAVGDYTAARTWARGHWAHLVWIYILVCLVVLGGFMLFIIPGLILSLVLYFSFYAYAVNGYKGFAALRESRRMFKGRFFTILAKIAGLGILNLIAFLVIFASGMALMLIVAMVVPALISVGVLSIVLQLFAGALMVITLRAGYLLYIAAAKTARDGSQRTWPYKVVAVLGFLFPAILAGVLYVTKDMTFSEFNYAQFPGEMDSPQSELVEIGFEAKLFNVSNNNSYKGLCDFLQEQGRDVTACNANSGAWAATIERADKQWCVDSSGYAKELVPPLEERTECLPL